MNLYFVCQNETYKQESQGQYLWSPQRASDGSENKGYKNMSLVKKGDIIFHGANQTTYAISIAKSDYFLAEQPPEIKAASKKNMWGNNGYRVDSDYSIFTLPVDMRSLYGWFISHYNKESAFSKIGTCKQGVYLSQLDKQHAIFIINKALELEQDYKVRAFLKSILIDISNREFEEYDDTETDEISKIIDAAAGSSEKPGWRGEPGKQEFINGPSSGNLKPKRNPRVAANALIIANHECENDHDPNKTFYKKSGVKYTEPHHLIPISKYKDFEYQEGNYRNLDTEENVVSLCSYCHNLLHYGRLEDKLPILEKLFIERQAALMKAGIEIRSVNDLLICYD